MSICYDLTPYVENQLDPIQANKFHDHLASCESCQRELALVNELKGRLAAEWALRQNEEKHGTKTLISSKSSLEQQIHGLLDRCEAEYDSAKWPWERERAVGGIHVLRELLGLPLDPGPTSE